MHVWLAGEVHPLPPEVVWELDAQDADPRRKARHSGHSFLAIGGPMDLPELHAFPVQLGAVAPAKAMKISSWTVFSARVVTGCDLWYVGLLGYDGRDFSRIEQARFV